MTAATVTSLHLAPSTTRDGVIRRARPSAFDRAIMRLSLAMLRWARNRANRSYRTWKELALQNRNALDRESRQNAAELGPLRLL